MDAKIDAVEQENNRAAWIKECGDRIARFAVVRSLPEHPGWDTLIQELNARAVLAKDRAATALDSVLANDTPGNRATYADARMEFFVVENSIQLWVYMRDAAREAEKYLQQQKVLDTPAKPE